MEIEEIIELIEQTGEKCLVLSQNKSAYVVLKAEDYRKLALHGQKIETSSRDQAVSKPNSDIRVYEIPSLKNEDNVYYPEPLG